MFTSDTGLVGIPTSSTPSDLCLTSLCSSALEIIRYLQSPNKIATAGRVAVEQSMIVCASVAAVTWAIELHLQFHLTAMAPPHQSSRMKARMRAAIMTL